MHCKRTASISLLLAALLGCGQVPVLRDGAGLGTHPVLPAPTKALLPTVNISPAVG